LVVLRKRIESLDERVQRVVCPSLLSVSVGIDGVEASSERRWEVWDESESVSLVRVVGIEGDEDEK
jgi:hypothetical protein